jgi:hypothetical protein
MVYTETSCCIKCRLILFSTISRRDEPGRDPLVLNRRDRHEQERKGWDPSDPGMMVFLLRGKKWDLGYRGWG